MSDVAQILSAIEQGDPGAAEELLPLVYKELRRLASQRLAREVPGQSLQSSDLVHQAYLRLVDQDAQAQWDSRAHFFAAAAEAMRRILVENARRKKRLKHGGGRSRVELEAVGFLAKEPSEDLEALDEALTKLAAEDPAKAELVNLRFFAAAAEAMRRILVEAARHKNRLKHGGGRMRVELEPAGLLAKDPSEDLEALDEALTKLAEEDPEKAELVKLRFFAGLTMPKIARVMKISLATAEFHWTYARNWLFAELKDRGDSANS